MWKATLLSAGVFFGGVAVTNHIMSSEVSDFYAELTDPPQTSIILCTYNEEAYVEQVLQSLLNQNVVRAYPERFELIVSDSKSSDHTVEIAEKYADKVLLSPKGKLNAKHYAILQSNGDVIVNVDADCYYPVNFINLLLKPFKDPEVVAVGGGSTSKERNLVMRLGFILQTWKHFRVPTLLGRSSAFKKNCYLLAGGFNLNCDQLNVSETQYWEEQEIAVKLQKLGKVLFEPKAVAVASSRGWYCSFRAETPKTPLLKNGISTKKFCSEIEKGDRM